MIIEPPNTKRVQEDILAERQGFTDKIGTALTQGVVEAFDVRCVACFLANRMMSFRGQHHLISHSEVGVTNSTFTAKSRTTSGKFQQNDPQKPSQQCVGFAAPRRSKSRFPAPCCRQTTTVGDPCHRLLRQALQGQAST